MPVPEKEGNKLAALLSDLLSFPMAGRQPEARPHRPNLYKSMSPALGSELRLAPTGPLQESQQDKRAVIYENCLKCQGECCQPPPRLVPAKVYQSSAASFSQPLPTALHLKRRQDGDEERLREAEGQSQSDEINGSVVSEGKRHIFS